jgi:iron-sulfur cluster repair protein YtfE (RIC family)
LAWLTQSAKTFASGACDPVAWERFRRPLTCFAEGLASHAHFENDLLFPRALEVERSLL